MIRIRKIALVTFIILILFVVLTNYFMNILSKSEGENEVMLPDKLSTIKQKILQEFSRLPEQYKTRYLKSDNISDTFIRNIETNKWKKDVQELWQLANSWVSNAQLYNISSPYIGNVLLALKTSKPIKADVDSRGTQLKLLLTLEGEQQVVFKPKWYEKDKIIDGPVYAGKDRYGSEILAFYLSAILNKPLTPIAVERKLSLEVDIIPKATSRLLATVFKHRNKTCLYGYCYYCKKEDPLCEENDGNLTGAVILNMNINLQSHKSPWQRTYKKHKKALWEIEDGYCRTVKNNLPKSTLYDLIDTAVFDFLIQNGDRHHYETLNGSVVLIDNGKGLGNPKIHHLDILAPLYQCCMLRTKTWNRLKSLSGGFISEKLKSIPDISNFVTEEHLHAVEERLLIIYATVEYCRNKN